MSSRWGSLIVSRYQEEKDFKYPVTRTIGQREAGMVGVSKGDSNYIVKDFLSNPCYWVVLKYYELFKEE